MLTLFNVGGHCGRLGHNIFTAARDELIIQKSLVDGSSKALFAIIIFTFLFARNTVAADTLH